MKKLLISLIKSLFFFLCTQFSPEITKLANSIIPTNDDVDYMASLRRELCEEKIKNIELQEQNRLLVLKNNFLENRINTLEHPNSFSWGDAFKILGVIVLATGVGFLFFDQLDTLTFDIFNIVNQANCNQTSEIIDLIGKNHKVLTAEQNKQNEQIEYLINIVHKFIFKKQSPKND